MELNLKDKVAVVTGAARGIGRAMAEELAKEGCKIAICDINAEALKETKNDFEKAGIPIYTEIVDVSVSEEMHGFAEKVTDTYGELNIWVNNAGIVYVKPLLELKAEEWRNVIRVNLDSCFFGIQAAAKEMIKTGSGAIVNISSYAAIMPTAYKASYAASKAGIIAITKETAGELGPYNIRVNAIAPGMIETDMMAARLGGPEREKILNRIALRKTGRPADIAMMCAYLASDAAAFISGSTYEVTGGMFCIQDTALPWGKY